MAKRSNLFLIGMVLLAVGIGLAVWGYNEAGSYSNKFNRALSGSIPKRVMMFYIGGAVCGIAGLALVVRK